MNDLRKYVTLAIVAFPIALIGCEKPATHPVVPTTVSGLASAVVESAQVPRMVEAAGTVHAQESAVLSSQVMGRVTSVLVREGDTVQSGQLLVSLDGAQALSDLDRSHAAVASTEAELKTAETDAALAKSTLARYQMLRDRKSVSPQEFDEVERRSESATARVKAARAHMLAAKSSEAASRESAGYSRLHAPFAGIVTARHVDPGTMATPGMPLLEVDKNGSLQLHVTVDESLLPLLRRGTIVPATIAASSQPLNGRIAEIVPVADPSSHSFLVKVDLPATAGLHPGMFGTAGIKTANYSALLVPESAVVNHGSLNSVWILDVNHIASLRYVTVGAKHDAMLEILSGVSSGETFVLSPGDRELGGNRIEVKQ